MKQSNFFRKQTENKLDEAFDEIKKENYDDTFYKTELWLRKMSESNLQKNLNNERIIIKMKNYILSHKLKIAYTFVALAFIIAACNYPVSQEENLGDMISWSVEKNNAEAVEKINQLGWIKNAKVSVYERNINGKTILEYNAVLSKESHSQSENFRNELASLSGIENLKLIPLNGKITRPVYSVALNKVFKVDIDATNMSNEELIKEITTQLENNGIKGVQVDIDNGKDGRRISRVFIPEQEIKGESGFDMTIKDGENEERIKQVRKKGTSEDMEKFKGKSDKEIKKMLMEELKDKEVTEDMIEIIRDGDKIMFEIKVDKGDKDKKFEFESELK